MGRFLWAVVIVILSILLVFQIGANSVQTNLFSLLPTELRSDVPREAVDAYAEKLSRKVLFLITAKDDSIAVMKAQELTSLLELSDLFAQIQAGLSEYDLEKIYKSYSDSRFALLSPKDRAGLKQVAEKWLTDKFTRLLVSPVSNLNSNTLKNDPFLLYQDFITQLPRGNPNARLSHGFTVFDRDNRVYLLISAELSAGAFTQDVQDRFVQLSTAIEEQFNSNNTNEKTVALFGVVNHAYENRKLAQQEMSTIGLGSLLGIISIFLFVFRRVFLLPIILLPVATGALTALTTGLLVFSELHLVSLVFGVSLIGVSIDYALHFCCAHSNLNESKNSLNAIKEVRSALVLGLITSAIGYLTLAIADFPALRQMAVIAVAGLLGAFLTVMTWMPYLLKKPLVVPGSIDFGVSVWIDKLKSIRPIPILFLLILLVGLFALNISIKNHQDDITIMRAQLPNIDRIDRHIQTVVGEFPNSQFFVVAGKSAHETIDKERRLVQVLQQGTTQAQRVYALSQWFPAAGTQQENFALFKSTFAQNHKLQQSLAAIGISQELFEDYRRQVVDASYAEFGVEQFIKTPLGQLHQHLWLGQINGEYYSIVGLYGFKDLDGLNKIAETTQTVLVDRAASISQVMAKYRQIIERMFPIVLLVIFLLLSFRFGIGDAFRVVSAPLLAALLGFLALHLLKGSYNLFSIFGLIITTAISIDYALFIRESADYNKGTYLAIGLASLTTLLALGLLSMSQTPALSFFGASLLFGTVFSLLLTPLIVRPKHYD